jgi:DNA-binding transcriptional LysR family regulator
MVRWEEAAGTALFDRSHRRIGFTGSGQDLAEAATAALETMRTTLGGALAPSDSKRLVIASLQSLGQSVVVELIAAFLYEDPTAVVRLVESASVEICAGVRGGRYDLGVVERPPDLAGFTWHPLGRQSLSLVMPVTGTRAGDDRADLAAFAGHQFVALDRKFHSRAYADILCREAGFTPNVVLESDDPARLRHYVGVGRGIAILPADLSINPRIRTLPIDSPYAIREFGLLTDSRRALSPSAKKFVSSVLAVGEQYPGWADLLDH